MLFSYKCKAQLHKIYVISLCGGQCCQVLVQLPLIRFVQRENDFGVFKGGRGQIKLSYLKSALVVYNTQGIVVGAHFEPVNVRKNAFSAQTEASLALRNALVSAH